MIKCIFEDCVTTTDKVARIVPLVMLSGLAVLAGLSVAAAIVVEFDPSLKCTEDSTRVVTYNRRGPFGRRLKNGQVTICPK